MIPIILGIFEKVFDRGVYLVLHLIWEDQHDILRPILFVARLLWFL